MVKPAAQQDWRFSFPGRIAMSALLLMALSYVAYVAYGAYRSSIRPVIHPTQHDLALAVEGYKPLGEMVDRFISLHNRLPKSLNELGLTASQQLEIWPGLVDEALWIKLRSGHYLKYEYGTDTRRWVLVVEAVDRFHINVTNE